MSTIAKGTEDREDMAVLDDMDKALGERHQVSGEKDFSAPNDEEIPEFQIQTRIPDTTLETTQLTKVVVKLPVRTSLTVAIPLQVQSDTKIDQDGHVSEVTYSKSRLRANGPSVNHPKKNTNNIQRSNTLFSHHSEQKLTHGHKKQAKVKNFDVKMEAKVTPARNHRSIKNPYPPFPPTLSHTSDNTVVIDSPLNPKSLPTLASSARPPLLPNALKKLRKSRAKPTFPLSQRLQHVPQKIKQRGLMASHNQDALYRPDWQDWYEVAVRVTGLPRDLHITIKDIWTTFRSQGQISTIELGDSGVRDGTALVRFSPPPRNAFWVRRTIKIILCETSPVTYYCQVQLDPARSTRQKFLHISSKSSVQYPHIMTLTAETLDFGFMYQPTTMMTMCTVRTKESHRIVFRLNLHHKELEVSFAVAARDARKRGREGQAKDDLRVLSFRYTIPLDQLTTIYEATSPNKVTWMFTVAIPPKFYWKGDEERTLPSYLEDRHAATFWNQRDTWYRRTDICYDRNGLRGSPLMLRKFNPIIDIGRWTTYRFYFLDEKSTHSPHLMMQEALKEHNVKFESLDGFEFVPKEEPVLWDCLQQSASGRTSASNGKVVDRLTLLENQLVEKDTFPVRYQLEVCLSQGYLNEHNLSRDFIDNLMAMDTRYAQEFLEYVANLGKRVYEPRKVLESHAAVGTRPTSRIPTYCTLVRSATVTPTMIYYNTPTVETSNRVIRQFAEHGDRFLRVRFTDEKNEGKVYSSDNDTNNEIFTRIKRAMAHGIVVGDRQFEFLAFGNSQFREHGAYFFARSPHVSSEYIRMWMGDFSDIRIVAKYAARLGQCFSTTRAINGTGATLIEEDDVEDIVGHTFTDGVGKISQGLAKFAANELGLSETPSAYQFRLGGCKGVLTSWPNIDKQEIHIRPSQYKFAANHEGLEINRWSQFGGAFLNRQLISVLSVLGVPDRIFVDKMTQQLSDLANAMIDSRLSENLLQKAIDANQMTLALASMVIDGFQDTREPFTISLLNLWRAWSTKYLKEKAKLFIQDGAFLLGCTDETRILQGYFADRQVGNSAPYEEQLKALPEVFVQISRGEDDPPQVITGPMSLARNPSLHPGDIRVVRGVNIPQLRHLINVVVLPQTGDRDLASMCSGGDLDGDDYLVMWDEALLPRSWNEEPMDYTAPPPLKLGRNVVMDDIHSFFVEHMKMDNLGKIATAHLAISDLSPLGVKDKKCIQLARLHSMAVDYAKTGIPAILPRELIPRSRPHFMEPKRKEPYHSSKVLGQLYDQVERIDFVPQFDAPFDKRILEAYELDEQTLSNARQIKKQYDVAMHRIMAQHDIKTEFEVWSTFVLHHFNQNKDYKFHEEIGRLTNALKDQFRTACYLKAGSNEFEDIGPFAAAMYVVTSEEVHQAVEECRQYKIVNGKSIRVRQPTVDEMPLMSFPWIFSGVLGKIASGKSSVPQAIQAECRRMTRKAPVPSRLIDDTLQTAEGTTHRGELLELFQHDGGNDMKNQRDYSGGERGPSEHPSPLLREMSTSSGFKFGPQNDSESGSPHTVWADLEGLDFHDRTPKTPVSHSLIDEGWETFNVSDTLEDYASQAEATSTAVDAYAGLEVFESLRPNSIIDRVLNPVTPNPDISNEQFSRRSSVSSLAQWPGTPGKCKSSRIVATQDGLSSTCKTGSTELYPWKEERGLTTIVESVKNPNPAKSTEFSMLGSAFPPLTVQPPHPKSQDVLESSELVMANSSGVLNPSKKSYRIYEASPRSLAQSYGVTPIDEPMMTTGEAYLRPKIANLVEAEDLGTSTHSLHSQSLLDDFATIPKAANKEAPVSMQTSPEPSERYCVDEFVEEDHWEDLLGLDNMTGTSSCLGENTFMANNRSNISHPMPVEPGESEVNDFQLDLFEKSLIDKAAGSRTSNSKHREHSIHQTHNRPPSELDLIDRTPPRSVPPSQGSPNPQVSSPRAHLPINQRHHHRLNSISKFSFPVRRREDPCPHCLFELPPKGPNNDESAQQAHIASCALWQFSALDTFNSPLAGPSGHRTSYSGSSDLIPDFSSNPVALATTTGSRLTSGINRRHSGTRQLDEVTQHGRSSSPSSDSSGPEEVHVTIDATSGSSAWLTLEEMVGDLD